MSTLGARVTGLKFPVCNQFRPTVLHGQVCYVLDLEEANPALLGGTQKGKERGLMLALNMNRDTSEEVAYSGQEWLDKDIFRTEVSDYGNTASIHLSTLDRFKDSKPGQYAMTSLKKMTGTDSFLDLPENMKDCQIEDQEMCNSRRYIEELQKQCKCLPWALAASIPQKVTLTQLFVKKVTMTHQLFVITNLKCFRIQVHAPVQLQTPALKV